MGLNILALQFHAEVDPHTFERWLIGHTAELNQAQVDILTLRQENTYYGKPLQEKASLLLRDWVRNLSPAEPPRQNFL